MAPKFTPSLAFRRKLVCAERRPARSRSIPTSASRSTSRSLSTSDPRLVDRFKDLAKERNIKHQLDILPFGGTDAGAIQITKAGVPAITMSVPVRYVHTVNEMALVDDIEATVDLLAGFLDVAGDLDLGR